MIIFYEKDTGRIVGTVEGRIHSKDHLNMWVGDKEKIDRIVVQWEAIEAETEEDGVGAGIYEPQHEQKDLFIELDKKAEDIYKYKVDLKTLKLVAI